MTQRVLIVDDEPSIRESLSRQLQQLGYVTALAESAEQGMGMLGEVDPGVVITDLRMSGATGLELLEWIRERTPDVDVLVMTAHQEMDSALRAMRAGAYDYLVKPMDLDQLELVLARCFRDRALRRRVTNLTEQVAELRSESVLVGRDPRMIQIFKLIAAVAASHTPVLIRGETGTGKEVVARAIHANGPSSNEPFVAVNCTAVPEPLLESELFGHLRGSFTGATSDRKGRFELAGTGTIFLDEIGDVSPAFQAKLLRVLQDGEFHPVGSERARRTTARVIAATHRPLEQLVREGAFRQDLYFRLRVVEIAIPPLRERRGDIQLIAEALLARSARAMHKQGAFIPDAVLRRLAAYDWPGNVRELENAITRALVLAPTRALGAEFFALDGSGQLGAQSPAGARDVTLAAAIHAHASSVLSSQGGNKTQAARALGISRQRLDRILTREDEESGAERTDAGSEA